MDFHYTVKSRKPVQEAIQSLEQNLKEEGFGVLWNFDLKGKLEEKGFGLDGAYSVLEVCNPKEAERVIKENKLTGYFLPCKIVVYQENDETKIGMPRPTALISMLDNSHLKELAEDIEKRLSACIDNSR